MNQGNNSMFHQVNGVVGDSNNSTMNLESLDNLMFQQGNGISNNGTMNLENFMFLQSNGDHHSRIPETPERQYIQRQGYQNSNWEGSVNPVFSPDASVMQRSNPSQNLSSEMQMNQIPFDIGHLTEESVYQMWAQIQRNHQIVQSANPQVQPRNNHGVLLDPKPSEMTLNQIGNGWQQSNPLPSRQISQTPDSVSTQMEGNQEHNSDWLETIGLYTSILHNSSTRLVNDGRNVGIGNVQGSFGDVDQYLGVSSTGLLPESNSSYSYNGNNWGQQNCANSNQWQQEHVSGLTLNQTTMLPAANSSWGQQNCDNSNVWQQEHVSGLTLNQTTKLPAANCSWGQQNCDNSNVWQQEHFSGLTLNQTTKLPAANSSWGQQNCANPNQWQQEQASGLTLNQTTMIPSANGPYSEIGNKWGQQNCANPNQWQQEHVSGLNQTTRGSTSLEKNLSDGFHIPFQPLYNNATPSHVGYGGSSSTTTTVYYNNAPVTPAKDYHQSSLSHISHALESWNPEKHKQHHTGPTSTNQPSTVDIASPSNSTSLKERVSEDNACVVTDSNKTPELKTPKRKKHRPKVVVEGKPKRTPKSAPPKTEVVAGEKSTGKRKYVRRKGVETSTPKNNEKNEFEGGSKSGSATRPCRRKLKFDSEQEINDSLNLSGSRLELSSQETTSSNDLNSVHVVPSTNIAQQNTDGAANQRIANEVPQCDLKAQARTQVGHVVLNRVCVQKEQMSFQELARVTYKIETQQLFSESGIHPINDCQKIKEKTGEKRDNRDISNLGADKRTRLNESRRVLSNVPSVTSAAENDQWHVCRSMFKCSTETKEASANRNNREIVFTENHFRNAMGAAHSSKKTKGKNEETMRPNLIDDLIQRLELLSINNQQSALVPYKGHGTLVPFEGFEPIRRRKTRPRVDLDSESITQWNLLMGKAENEAPDTSQDKEKWWENERKVFRGRVDTFIARMHLVQGDRRFSRWKGSVVDSVIGVFLTQNVSDHLSSSAYMSLAAQFPLKTATTEITSYQTSTSAWVEEPEAQIIDPDGTITFPWGTLRQPLDKQDSTASSQYFEQSTENLIKALEVHLMEDNKGTSKDMVSSQNSSDSIILQANEDTRNGSDSEVEYQTIIPNPNQGADTFLQDPFLTRSPKKDYLSCVEKNPKLNISKNVGSGPIDLNVLSSEESLNSISDTRVTKSFFPVPTEAEATKIQGVFPVMMGAESIPVALTSSITKETETLKNNASSTEQYSAASHNVNSQPSTNINQNQGSKNFNYQTSTAMEAQRPDEAHSKQKTENVGSKMPNERRKKNHVDKQKEIDWDELRRQVLCQNRNKERGNDKMDSMDYHDMSHSDVSKISDAIRERGMNNMLAERIKAFLNRLVKDHGSIDLEWLRDAPPDKAKDYLLSIRGLGLKSVECIRLLSLHHMAFPVDTNVGRIAVRLGWVPLRPLPESLQLHLLELYPILESIQKYIWPRLCKLDQLTLYELHYQMITFGKVFCTKSRPNCNGCPMKGECRHFASAYASARLALPGPEEKGMVSSNIQFAPTEELPIIMDPLLLASSESNLNRGILHFIGNSEPFIEEPTSPEICKQETESDIEDILPEEEDDTNEIPVIEESIEALKANVHNIMQERNLEISEGDISKALVALNPATASIPAPKLKNVSRLRTEHQVYELPDWHHLLEGMDKREPDDPSPYLLAIWTPGETADSVNPYENNCTLRGSGRLCDEKTCFHCNSVREADSQIIRGTILIPCRTAMRGSFPLNGTYFQVNEVFADHESSMNPISVPRDSIWNLRRRTVYFGTSATTIFRGMPIEEIQYCFWRGFVCVRGFDRKCRAPRPLMARLHFPASKLLAKNKKEEK